MARSTSSPILQLVRGLFEDRSLTQFSDQELLCRFSLERHEESFLVPLRRHGPMVCSIRRRPSRYQAKNSESF